MSERICTVINRVGDVYHREIYSRIASTTARLTDYKFAVSDLAVLPMVYSPEICIASTIGVVEQIASSFGTHSTGDVLSDLAKWTGIGVATIITTYGANYFRTPIDKKMRLEPNKNMQVEDELAFAIGRLNGLKNASPIEAHNLAEHTYLAVDEFVKRNQGYSINASRRVKYSKFSDLMMWKHRAQGFMNPFLQEIVMFSRQTPEAFAHEQAHLQGIPQERLAEFVGIAAQVESADPYIRYLGYKAWMGRLVQHQSREWGVEPDGEGALNRELVGRRLEERGLDAVIIADLMVQNKFLDGMASQQRSYSKYTGIVVDRALGILPEKIRSKIPGGLANILRSPEIAMTEGMRWAILATSGQRNAKSAYGEQPLQLLSSYRQEAWSA